MLKIRNVSMNDLPDLVIIEQLCFPMEEEATEKAFISRIQMIPDSFFVAVEEGVVIGLVNGPVIENEFITDDLFSNIKEESCCWRTSNCFGSGSDTAFSNTWGGNGATYTS